MNTPTRRIVSVVLAGLLAAGAVGCGNKGPLVLPEAPPVDGPEEGAGEAGDGAPVADGR